MTRFGTAAAALAFAIAGPALAQQDPNYGLTKVELRVSAADLDLSTEAGADAFLKRLSAAARRACGRQPGPGVDLLQKSSAFRECTARALDAAVAQVGAPLVRQRFADRVGKPGLRLVRR